jgi:hypothetical protein
LAMVLSVHQCTASVFCLFIFGHGIVCPSIDGF